MKGRKRLSAIVALLALVNIVAGCVASLPRQAAPQSGRFTVLVRDTGKIWVDGEYIRVENTAYERLGQAVADQLKSKGDYEYVPVSVEVEYFPPEKILDYRSALNFQFQEDAYVQQEAQFQEVVARVAKEHGLDFVVLVTQYGWRLPNKVYHGSGVSFWKYLTGNVVTVYVGYRLQFYDANLGKFSSIYTGIDKKDLPDSYWIDVGAPGAVTPDSMLPYVEHVEDLVPPDDLKEGLCYLGLLAIPRNTPGRGDWVKCMNAYPGGHLVL